MTVPLIFRDVTLGYDRHPAVHHLSGAFAAGALAAVVGPNGAGKTDLLPGVAGTLGATCRGRSNAAAARAQDGVSAAGCVELDRSFPVTVLRFRRAWACGARLGVFGGTRRRRERATVSQRAGRRGPAAASSAASIGTLLGRPGAARAVRARCCCRTPR
ncbi:MAG: hypothetical protein MZV49_14705 [Rhodopseudomonas palustris]|nr:hypothetical protein [Rhodopseudomonas palustris]